MLHSMQRLLLFLEASLTGLFKFASQTQCLLLSHCLVCLVFWVTRLEYSLPMYSRQLV